MKNLLFFSYLFFILLLSSKPSILNAQCFDSGVLELSSLDGNNGFVLNGLNSGYESGTSVSNVGDVNGDGFDDLIIGAPGADGPSGDFYVGESYLVFGNSSIGNGGSVDLDNLNGTNGFTIYGVDDFDAIGGLFSSNAGDINADGIDDLIIGVSGANENGISNSGASYVVFGSLNLGSGGNFF